MSTLTNFSKALEHFETDPWAVKSILRHEILTPHVIDPCVGTGILAEAAIEKGHTVFSVDIHDWGYPDTIIHDFLALESLPENVNEDFSILMNPPFSRAEEFVEHSLALGARKILCFQRFAWWESSKRAGFWDKNPPNRIYICGDRATCWRHDLPKNDKGRRTDPATGKELAGTTTAHAWFVWERGHPKGTQLSHIYKSK